MSPSLIIRRAGAVVRGLIHSLVLQEFVFGTRRDEKVFAVVLKCACWSVLACGRSSERDLDWEDGSHQELPFPV